MGAPIIFNGNAAKLLKSSLIIPGGTGTTAVTLTVPTIANSYSLALPLASGTGVMYAASGQLSFINPGSGVGVTNLFNDNGGFEIGTLGYSTYFNTPGPAPVTGSGGVPSGTTITRTTTTPLFGSGSGLISKDAVNRQGEGVSYQTSVPLFMRGTQATLSFDYAINSGTYATGDIGIYFVDSTNNVVIQPTGYQLVNTSVPSAQAVVNVQIPYNCLSLNVCWHVATTSALAYTVKIDNVILSRQPQSQGSVDTDWQTYTPTIGALGTGSVASISGRWRRIGDTMEIEFGAVKDGSAGSGGGNVFFTIPSGFSIDQTKLPSLVAYANTVGSGNMNGAVQFATVLNASVVNIYFGYTGTQVPASAPMSALVQVPIVGWSSNNVTSDQTANTVIAMRATSSTTTATGSANTTVVNPTVVNDTTGGYNTSTGIYTVTVPGYYVVGGGFFGGSGTGGSLASTTTFQVLKNGAAFAAIDTYVCENTTASQKTFNGSSGPILCNAGDTLALQVSNNNSTFAGSGSSSQNYITIERVAGPNQITAADTVAARIYASTTTVSATLATIVYNTVDFVTGGTYSAGVWTCPAPGKYQVNVGLQIAGTIVLNSVIQMQVLKNGAAYAEHESYAGGGMAAQDAQISDVLNLKAGDTVSVVARSSASAPTISASNSKNFLSIIRVGAFN